MLNTRMTLFKYGEFIWQQNLSTQEPDQAELTPVSSEFDVTV